MTIDEFIEFYKDTDTAIICDEVLTQLFNWLEELKALRLSATVKCDNLNTALEHGKEIGYEIGYAKALDDLSKNGIM